MIRQTGGPWVLPLNISYKFIRPMTTPCFAPVAEGGIVADAERGFVGKDGKGDGFCGDPGENCIDAIGGGSAHKTNQQTGWLDPKLHKWGLGWC